MVTYPLIHREALVAVDYVNTLRAQRVDLVIEQGSDLDVPISAFDEAGDERDFTNYTAVLHVREFIDSSDTLFEMSTTIGNITTDDGKVTLHFARADFEGVDWRDGEYDLEVTSQLGKRERLMKGHFRIDPEVTR